MFEWSPFHLLPVTFPSLVTSSGEMTSLFSSSSSVIPFFAFACRAKNPPPFFFDERPASSFELAALFLFIISLQLSWMSSRRFLSTKKIRASNKSLFFSVSERCSRPCWTPTCVQYTRPAAQRIDGCHNNSQPNSQCWLPLRFFFSGWESLCRT